MYNLSHFVPRPPPRDLNSEKWGQEAERQVLAAAWVGQKGKA